MQIMCAPHHLYNEGTTVKGCTCQVETSQNPINSLLLCSEPEQKVHAAFPQNLSKKSPGRHDHRKNKNKKIQKKVQKTCTNVHLPEDGVCICRAPWLRKDIRQLFTWIRC